MDEPRVQSATASSQRIPSTRSSQRRRIQHRQRARGHKKRTSKRNEKEKKAVNKEGLWSPDRQTTRLPARLCPRRRCVIEEGEALSSKKCSKLKMQVEGRDTRIHVPTPCPGFLGWFSPGREGECRGGGRKGPRSAFPTLPDQGTAAPEEEAAAVGTTASPEGGAVLRAPYGWESMARWCSRRRQEDSEKKAIGSIACQAVTRETDAIASRRI